MLPCPRTDVHHVVGGPDGGLVVLHHDEGVAHVAQLLQGGDEAAVVALVQADGGLVQDVEDPDQARAYLGGQADALRLATGQGGGGAVQGEVVQAHVDQEAQARRQLLEDAPGYGFLGGGEGEDLQKSPAFA